LFGKFSITKLMKLSRFLHSIVCSENFRSQSWCSYQNSCITLFVLFSIRNLMMLSDSCILLFVLKFSIRKLMKEVG
jgi:hypothetical protein